MKYALVNGERQLARPGAPGICPECEAPVIAKCGTVVVHHWAHTVSSNCNSRWENEGPWHQAWKSHFPENWQEIVHFDDKGEKHVADVKTDCGWVLEFQHSLLKPEERRSRNAFYCPKLIWVVDALRRKTDAGHFDKMMSGASRLDAMGSFWAVSAGSCRLVKEWAGSDAQVLFDFGPSLGLWWMLGRLSNDQVLFARYAHGQFVEAHGRIENQKDTDFDALVKQLATLVNEYQTFIGSRPTIRIDRSLPTRRRPMGLGRR